MVERALGIDVRGIPGGGASGGLGASLHAFLGAELTHYSEIAPCYRELDTQMEDADLVITAEGTIDFTTSRGKIPVEVSERAKRHQLPVVAIAGSIGESAHVNYELGIDAIMGILEVPSSLDHAILSTAELLERGAERLMRVLLVGCEITP